MKCLRDNKFENALCRHESKEYLECRMERQVRAPPRPDAAFPEAPAAAPVSLGTRLSQRPLRRRSAPPELGPARAHGSFSLGAPRAGRVPPSVVSAGRGGCRHCGFGRVRSRRRGAVARTPLAVRWAVWNVPVTETVGHLNVGGGGLPRAPSAQPLTYSFLLFILARGCFSIGLV